MKTLHFAAHRYSQADAFTAAACVLDDNYGTRWVAAGDAKGATIEASTDGKSWQVVDDFSKQPVSGSPIVSEKPVTARYLRLVFPDDVKGSDISLIEWTVF